MLRSLTARAIRNVWVDADVCSSAAHDNTAENEANKRDG